MGQSGLPDLASREHAHLDAAGMQVVDVLLGRRQGRVAKEHADVVDRDGTLEPEAVAQHVRVHVLVQPGLLVQALERGACQSPRQPVPRWNGASGRRWGRRRTEDMLHARSGQHGRSRRVGVHHGCRVAGSALWPRLEHHHAARATSPQHDGPDRHRSGPLPPLDVSDERPDVEVVSLCGRDTRATSVSPRSARSTTALTVL